MKINRHHLGLLFAMLSLSAMTSRLQGTPITLVELDGYNTAEAWIGEECAFDYDPYLFSGSPDITDSGGAGAWLENAYAYSGEHLVVGAASLTFRYSLAAAVMSEAPNATACADIYLSLLLHLDGPCDYFVFDESGTLLETGVQPAGPWRLSFGESLRLDRLGEMIQQGYLRFELVCHMEPPRSSVPDAGPTGWLTGLGLLALTLQRRWSA